jgi:large subunit ribosomal protein L22
MKRIHPRSQGRAFRIEKPLTHLTVIVADKEN